MKQIEEATGRILVKALRPGKEARNAKGNICGFAKDAIFYISQEDIDEYNLIDKGIVILWHLDPPKPKAKEVKDTDKANCLWLKPCIGWAYSEGEIARLPREDVEKLIASQHVEYLPDNYVKPGPEKPPALDGPIVKFIKSEQSYGCVAGEETKVYKSEAIRLLNEGFVDLATKDQNERNQIFRDLGYVLDPIDKKLVRY
jgi:hypothetical protein